MSSVQFTTLIRLPFARGSFEDPPQAQWDGERDRQLWKIISKSSKTSDLNWVDLATKFQVPPTFLLQQAAWLYERHLDHVRNQMKKVSGSNVPTISTSGASTLTSTGGYAMRRTGSAGSGAPRTVPVFPAKPKDNPSVRGGETVATAPPLSRTPSTNTITQSRANNQQVPVRSQSTRSAQRPSVSSPSQEERRQSTHDVPPPSALSQDLADSPGIPDSSSSSSSGSDVDLPTHRSQLFKRPPRFKPQKSEGLSTFDEDDGNQAGGGSAGHGQSNLPFATAARQSAGQKYAQDTFFRTSSKREPKSLADRNKFAASPRQKLADQRKQSTTETVSPMTSPASTTDAPTPSDVTKSPISPASNHRVDLGRLGSPRQRDTRARREGSEGTPSMGSSFSDIDDAGISQSALEEALLSNMQHGRMSTLSRMSRYL